jgi:large conductance mechanosensitive channel
MATKTSPLQGFKSFLLRGNVVDLAVAVVVGVAFAAVVKSLVENVITPIVSAITGNPSFRDSFVLTINGSKFLFGSFLTDVITFVSIAAAVYFLVVVPVNTLMARFASGEEVAEVPDPQLTLLAEIRDLLAGEPVDEY